MALCLMFFSMLLRHNKKKLDSQLPQSKWSSRYDNLFHWKLLFQLFVQIFNPHLTEDSTLSLKRIGPEFSEEILFKGVDGQMDRQTENLQTIFFCLYIL